MHPIHPCLPYMHLCAWSRGMKLYAGKRSTRCIWSKKSNHLLIACTHALGPSSGRQPMTASLTRAGCAGAVAGRVGESGHGGQRRGGAAPELGTPWRDQHGHCPQQQRGWQLLLGPDSGAASVYVCVFELRRGGGGGGGSWNHMSVHECGSSGQSPTVQSLPHHLGSLVCRQHAGRPLHFVSCCISPLARVIRSATHCPNDWQQTLACPSRCACISEHSMNCTDLLMAACVQ